jgi:hypothetical protein
MFVPFLGSTKMACIILDHILDNSMQMCQQNTLLHLITLLLSLTVLLITPFLHWFCHERRHAHDPKRWLISLSTFYPWLDLTRLDLSRLYLHDLYDQSWTLTRSDSTHMYIIVYATQEATLSSSSCRIQVVLGFMNRTPRAVCYNPRWTVGFRI